MTNREAIIKNFGDSLIACQLIEKVHYYKSHLDYRQKDWDIVYKFNHKIYPNLNDAFKAVKEWLDKEEETSGCVHPEDEWTNYWCGDCGEYATHCGCRGPRGV